MTQIAEEELVNGVFKFHPEILEANWNAEMLVDGTAVTGINRDSHNSCELFCYIALKNANFGDIKQGSATKKTKYIFIHSGLFF